MTGRLLMRGLTLRCARCGSRGLFRRWFSMVDDCPRCGYHFEREEGFFLGAYVMNLGVTQIAVVVYIAVSVVSTLPSPPLARLAIGGAAVALLVPALAYPFSKTLWTAFDLIMHPGHMQSFPPPEAADVRRQDPV